MSEYKYNVKEVLKERIPCWIVEVIKDGVSVKSTELMSEGGCIKWAGDQIMRMQREDAKRPTMGTSWIEETFRKR